MTLKSPASPAVFPPLLGIGGAVVIFLLNACCLAAPALAATIDHLQRQGVEAYEAGEHEQALAAFSQAVAKKPADSTALYNQGTALYKLGRFSEASQAFAASAATTANHKARARAQYNQGRSLLAEAGPSQDLAAKKELLLAANQAFQQALRDDPRLLAARKGIEDFRKEFAKINKQPAADQAGQGNQQQGQQGQGQDQQDLQQQLNEAGRQQQDMADQSKEAGADDSQAGSAQQSPQEMAAKQQSVRQALEKIKDELNQKQAEQDGGEQSQQDLAKALEQAINEQKKAEEALNRGNVNEAQEHQQQAADTLQEMAAELSSEQPEQQEQSASAAADQDNEGGESENASPADQQQGEEQDAESASSDSTVADILDGEKALHEMRRLRVKQQRPASGKDW